MWWVGKKEGKLLVTMFGNKMPNGETAMAWDVLDESNLPVDLIRRDGEEYSFILPVGLQGSSIEKVGEGVRLDMPITAADVGAGLSGALADIDAVLPTGSVGNDDVTDGRPVKGVSTHDGGVLNYSTNAKHIHPPTTNSESKEPRSSGLDDAPCCASSFVGEGYEYEFDGVKYTLGRPERLCDLVDEITTEDGTTLWEHLLNPNAKSPLKAYLDAQVLRDRQDQMTE